jgi:outer membrane protein OmpA-like peptidoglycan-associated protein
LAAPAPAAAKLYFETGKTDLPGDSDKTMAAIVAAAKANAGSLAISGYHDAAGNLEQNQELAKQRALKVRDALKAAGIPEERIELRKPEQTQGSGNDAEARRVEIKLK